MLLNLSICVHYYQFDKAITKDEECGRAQNRISSLISASLLLFCDVYKQTDIFLTLVGLLRFASHLSNPLAIAITAVVDAMEGFVPCLSNLVERSGLWLLTLVCCTKK